MTDNVTKHLFTANGQYIVRDAHPADALHILAMPDTSNEASIGRQLINLMVSRSASNNITLNKLGKLPILIDSFNQQDLRNIVRSVWNQSGFIPPSNEDYSLESLGAAALRHYRAAETVERKRFSSPASAHGQGSVASANFVNALADLKKISDRASSTTQAMASPDANSALKDLVSQQADMSRGFARLHEVIVKEVVPGWLEQAEEAGRTAAKSIRLTGIGLVITIGVSVLVAAMQMYADQVGGLEASQHQETMISLLEKQLNEEKEIRSELTLQLNLLRSESRETTGKLAKYIKNNNPSPENNFPGTNKTGNLR